MPITPDPEDKKLVVTRKLRRLLLDEPGTPPHLIAARFKTLSNVHYSYYRRLIACIDLNDTIAAIRMAIDNGLDTYNNVLETTMRRACEKYAVLWNELAEMAHYPDWENPYIDKHIRRSYARRTRVREELGNE